MAKQVEKTTSPEPVVAPPEVANSQANNLFVSVVTFNEEGRTVGERIVDMHHFGTRNWLQSHFWWAMHNKNSVEMNVCTPEQVATYLDSGKQALAEKFNAPKNTEKTAA